MKYPLLRCAAFAALLLSGLMGGGVAHAAISCTARMGDIAFGSVDPQATGTDATSTLSYTCENNGLNPWSARICFSIGVPGGGATNSRQMDDDAGNTLDFQLYQDPGRTQVWGTQYSGSSQPLIVDLTIPGRGLFQPPVSVSRTAQLYGRVRPAQTLAIPGAYSSEYLPADTAYTVNDRIGSTSPDSCSGATRGRFRFVVSASVAKKCTVTVSPLNFGSNAGLLNSDVDATTTLGVQCSRTTPYNVGLDAGQNSGGDINARRMVLGGSAVGYQLYMDAARSIVWGNTIGTDTAHDVGAGMGSGNIQTLTVYGTVPSQPTPPAGTYEDTVVVTVTY